MSEENQQDSQSNKEPANPNLENVQANKPEYEPETQEQQKNENGQEDGKNEQTKSDALNQQDAENNSETKKPLESVKSKSGDSDTVKPKKTVSVSANSAVPKKIAEEKKKPSKTKFLLGCAGGAIIIFIVFIVLMVLMISRAGATNPVMRAFGIDPAGIKSFLLTVVGLSFGFLALLFFVLMIIGIFRLAGAKKNDKERRSKSIKMTIFSLIPLIFVVFIWFVIYNFIGRVQIAAEQVIAEIIIVHPKDITELTAPVEITFSALNVAKALEFGKFQIQNMSWDLDGDNFFETPVNNPEVVHLYNRRGIYNIGLQVNITGEEQPRVYNETISISDAVFDADPSFGYAPLQVQFNAKDLMQKGAKIQSLDWDFDNDGMYELDGPDNLAPRYKFEKIGIYTVHLRIIDQKNNVENYYRDIELTPSDTPLLVSVIDVVPGVVGSAPFQVRFDGSQSKSLKGKIVSYKWDFGDGDNLQDGKSVSHIFDNSGYYNVVLTVKEDSGKTASSSLQIDVRTVSSIPSAVITTDPPYDKATNTLHGILPFKVSFDASKSVDEDDDIVDYEWDFNGDDITDQEGEKISYIFDEAGKYETRLTVRDTESQSSTFIMNVVVDEPGVKAVINAEPFEGTAPLIVNFNGSSSSAFEGNIVSYEWDFGDGSPKTITGSSVSHKYNQVGNYTVKLNVLTNKSESAETSYVVYVREIPLQACFEPSRNNGSAPFPVTFNSKCSTGAVSVFSWDFGDGEQSDSRKPSHTFENPGNYTVTLEVSDDKNNVSSYSDVIVVQGEVTE